MMKLYFTILEWGDDASSLRESRLLEEPVNSPTYDKR